MYLERIQTGRRFHLKVFLSQSSNRKGHVNAQIFEQATTVGANTHLIYKFKWLIEYVPSSTGR